MARPLEMGHGEKRDKMSRVEALRSRVESDIEGHLPRAEELFEGLLVRALLDKAPLFQFTQTLGHRHTLLYFLISSRIFPANSAMGSRICSIGSLNLRVTVLSSLV